MAKKLEQSEKPEKSEQPMLIVPEHVPPLAENEVPIEPNKQVEPLVPFDRWFKAKGHKERWKAGMVAFTNTSIRHSMSEWDEIFRNY